MRLTKAGIRLLVESFAEWSIERMNYYKGGRWGDKDRKEYLNIKSFIYEQLRSIGWISENKLENSSDGLKGWRIKGPKEHVANK